MDTSITLRHKATEQTCDFDDQNAADEFLANVESAKDWVPAGAAPAIEAPAAVAVPDVVPGALLPVAEAAPAPAPKPAVKPRAKK